MGHAKKERVGLVGTDQRITSRPAAKRPHSKAEYMNAPERFADSQIPLAPRAPSIHGPERPHRDPRSKWASVGYHGKCRRTLSCRCKRSPCCAPAFVAARAAQLPPRMAPVKPPVRQMRTPSKDRQLPFSATV